MVGVLLPTMLLSKQPGARPRVLSTLKCPFPAEMRDKDRLATFDTPVFNLKPSMALEVLVDHSLQTPASAGPSQSTSHPEGVGYLTTDQFLKHNSAYVAASPHALRAVASVRDKVCLLSQADCVNDARVLHHFPCCCERPRRATCSL